jgi:aminopeptidase
MRAGIVGSALSLFALGAAPPAVVPHVDMQRMSQFTRVMASDEFQGRAPGTPGEYQTIPYLIEQFKAAGLEPAGENGGWAQTVPMIRTQLKSPMQVSVTQAGATTSLKFPDDVYLGTVRATDHVSIANAPMVFVGYGVSARERGWDDFKGIDLRGKVALFLVNDPDFEAAPGEPVAGKFGGRTMTYYGRWTYKYEEAARRGAIGALIVHETEAAGYP